MVISEKEAERMGIIPKQKTRKLHNVPTEMDDIRFDSKREADRYSELKKLERAGLIEQLQLQREFLLIPAQFEWIPKKRGSGYKKGKCLERAVKYIADFYYFDVEKGKYVCEDVKGMRTDVYILKRKLMLLFYGIRIVEV